MTKKNKKGKKRTGVGPESSVPRKASLQIESEGDDDSTPNISECSPVSKTEEPVATGGSDAPKDEVLEAPVPKDQSEKEDSEAAPVLEVETVSSHPPEQISAAVNEPEEQKESKEPTEPTEPTEPKPESDQLVPPNDKEEASAVSDQPAFSPPTVSIPPSVLQTNASTLSLEPEPDSPALLAHSPLFSQDAPRSIFDHLNSMFTEAASQGDKLSQESDSSPQGVSKFVQLSRDILVQIGFMEKSHPKARSFAPLKQSVKAVEEAISMLKTDTSPSFVEGLVLNLKVLQVTLRKFASGEAEDAAPTQAVKPVAKEEAEPLPEKSQHGNTSLSQNQNLSTGATEVVPEVVVDHGSPVATDEVDTLDAQEDEVLETYDYSKYSKEELVEKITQLAKNRDEMFQHLIARKSVENESAEQAKVIEKLTSELEAARSRVRTLEDSQKDLTRGIEALEIEVSMLKKANKKLEESRAEAVRMAILEYEEPEQNDNLMQLIRNDRPSVAVTSILSLLDSLLARNTTMLNAGTLAQDVATLNALLKKTRSQVAPYRDALGKVEQALLAGTETAEKLKSAEATVASQQTKIEELEKELKASKRSSRLISSEPFLAKPLSADTEAPPTRSPPVRSPPSRSPPAPTESVESSEEDDDEQALISKTMALLKNEIDLPAPEKAAKPASAPAEPAQKPAQSPSVSKPKALDPNFTIPESERAAYEKAAINIQKRLRGSYARKLRKNEIVKYHVAKEILDTEESFVLQLRHLVLDYMAALGKQQGKESPISQELWSDLFNFVPGVLEYNSELLKLIRTRVKDNWHFEQKIGDVFVQASSKLANYTNYVNNYHRALGALHQCQKNANFVALCQETYNRSKVRLTLGDLLIIPIQRIPRYVLLLEQILKKTSLTHPDKEDLELAIKLLKETAAEINKKKGESMKFQEIIDLQGKITNYPYQKLGDLANPDRVMILEADLEERMSNGSFKDRHIFLFNDMILCTKAVSQQGFFKNNNSALEFKWASPLSCLDNFETNLKDSDATRPFTIALNLKNFKEEDKKDRRVLAFTKEEEKNEWAEELKKALESDIMPTPSFQEQPRKPSTGFFRTRPSDKGRVLSGTERPRTIILGGGTDPGTPGGPSTPLKESTPTTATSLTKMGSESKPKLPDIIRKMESEKGNIDTIKRELSEAAKKGKTKEKEALLQKLADAHKSFESLQKEAQTISIKTSVPRRLSAGNPAEALASREAKTPTN